MRFERRPSGEGSDGVTVTALVQRKQQQRVRGTQLCCAACRHLIADTDQRITCNGSHRHRFENPHGLSFEIGCFAAAPGCRCRGPLTETFSWFQGYAWQIATCGECDVHLGWRYALESREFFGLILARLVPIGSAPPGP